MSELPGAQVRSSESGSIVSEMGRMGGVGVGRKLLLGEEGEGILLYESQHVYSHNEKA